MLIVDTNVISELMRPAPAASVAQWFDHQPLERLAITAVTVGEILYGLDRLPDGRRRIDLAARFVAVLRRAFFSRILPFDEAAAAAYARIRGDRDRMGQPISVNDAMIAAIARTRSVTIVTSNVADFEQCGISILDPWTAPGR
jgi:predicted nucleic acid-binding protein